MSGGRVVVCPAPEGQPSVSPPHQHRLAPAGTTNTIQHEQQCEQANHTMTLLSLTLLLYCPCYQYVATHV